MLQMAVRESITAEFSRQRVNSRKAAEIAGVTERTIRNWVRLGWVEYVRTPGRGVRIYVDTLLRRPRDN
jgi:excisionase family DNA binding protein